MRAGEQLRHDAYERLKTQLVVISRELGFFEAVLMQNELLVDPEKREASVVLVLDTGVRFHFGDLHINGEVLEESVIRRFVQFKSGAPFEQVYVRRLRTDLMQGGYFSSVDVRTKQLEDKSVDVHLEVSEARRIRYGVGVGFGTDTGLIVRGDVENRHRAGASDVRRAVGRS